MSDNPATSLTSIPFPLAGLNRRYGYQQQPPFTTPDALNVRPSGGLEGRGRGGSRPGLGHQLYTDALAKPPRMMRVMTSVTSTNWQEWFDDFSGERLLHYWQAPGWTGVEGLPDQLSYEPGVQAVQSHRAATLGDPSMSPFLGLDKDHDHNISIFIRPTDGSHGAQSVYRLYALMLHPVPSLYNDGLEIVLTLGPLGQSSVTMNVYAAGTLATVFGPYVNVDGLARAGWLQARIEPQSGGTVVHLYWLNHYVASCTAYDLSSGGRVGARLGFGMGTPGVPTVGPHRVDRFHLEYAIDDEIPQSMLLYAEDGWLHKSTGTFSLEDASEGKRRFVTDRDLEAAQRHSRLFVADHDFPVLKDVDGTITMPPSILSFIGGTLDTPGPNNLYTLVDNGNSFPFGETATTAITGLDLVADVTGNRYLITHVIDSQRVVVCGPHSYSQMEALEGPPPWYYHIDRPNYCTLTAPSISDWTTLGLDLDEHVVVLVSGDTINPGVYIIGEIKVEGLVIGRHWAAQWDHGAPTPIDFMRNIEVYPASTSGSCVFHVLRAPKSYDTAAHLGVMRAHQIWQTDETAPAGTYLSYAQENGLLLPAGRGTPKGTVPWNCTLITRWKDRVVLAGDLETPQAWYMSRVGDPDDFDYYAGSDDAGRAVAGVLVETGTGGVPITAIAAHSDDYLLFFSIDKTYVLRGNPALGGQLDTVSHVIGAIGPRAWCAGPAGETIFLSQDGLYMLPPGATETPQSVSRESLPNELVNLDSEVFSVILVYDVTTWGVYIFVVAREASMSRRHWWLDWNTGSLWPFTLPSSHEPITAIAYPMGANNGCSILLGCRDGCLRTFRDAFEHDDGGNLIESRVLCGPFQLGTKPDSEGLLSELTGVLAERSGPVAWSLITGETQQQAREGSDWVGGEWTAGINQVERPRMRGRSFCLKLASVTNAPTTPQRWVLEEIMARIKPVGKQRL